MPNSVMVVTHRSASGSPINVWPRRMSSLASSREIQLWSAMRYSRDRRAAWQMAAPPAGPTCFSTNGIRTFVTRQLTSPVIASALPSERNPHRERCALAGSALGLDFTAVFLHDLVADRQSEAGSLSHRFGREEGIEDAANHLGRYAGAGVPDDHARRVSVVPGLDSELARPGHGLGGVGQEVEEDLIDLRTNGFHRGHLAELPVHGDPILQQVVQQGQARLDLLVEVDRLPGMVIGPGEDPEVAHDLSSPLGPLPDSLDHRVQVLE